MAPNFLDEIDSELLSRTEAPKPDAEGAPDRSKRPSGKGKGRRGRNGKRTGQKPVPKRLATARKTASEGGVVVVAFLADATMRAIMAAPRIESRGFFLPHETREGHKLLLSESRRSYEETLKDVPDIETRDLEKIVKKDLEKAISERFSRSPLVIIMIQTL
jgi:mRNA degradation ribonuclease J1/J2